MHVEPLMFICILFMSIITIKTFLSLNNDKTYKLIIIGLGISVFIYSGIGISYEEINNLYYFAYQIYLICIFLAFYLTVKGANYKKKKINITIGKRIINKQILLVLSIVYFITKLSYLLFPTFRLQNLIIPPTLNVYGVGVLKNQFESSPVLSIASLIGVLTLPFFFILLSNMLKSGKRYTVLLLILFWGYLDYAIYEYVSRSDILTIFLFAYLVSQYKDDELKIKHKHIVISLVGILVIIPLLYLFGNYRLTHTFEFSNMFSSYINIFTSETSYPRFYDILYNSDSYYGIGNYLLWLTTLPVPKFFVPIEIQTFNAYFTDLIDVHLGYIVLPSILGESFMIFGKHLFWLHGLLLGSILGMAYKVLRRYEFAPIIVLYIGVLSFSIGRGGSMQIISFCINSLLAVWIGILISKISKSLYNN